MGIDWLGFGVEGELILARCLREEEEPWEPVEYL
jgi:hypothetical protein